MYSPFLHNYILNFLIPNINLSVLASFEETLQAFARVQLDLLIFAVESTEDISLNSSMIGDNKALNSFTLLA